MAFSLFLLGSPTIALSVREGGCADAASGLARAAGDHVNR
jgi:hypothetical protein